MGVPNPISDRALVAEFIADRAPTVTHLVDDAAEIWQHYEIATQPAMVLVSADGQAQVLAPSQGRTGLWWQVRDSA